MKTIELTQGKQALVCDCHYDLVSRHKWCFDGHDYATHRVNGKTERMHQLIIKAESGLHTDHIDGNGLNNQCSNLRVATPRQNSQNVKVYSNNTSGGKGVSYTKTGKRVKRWRARIVVDGTEKYLGRYRTCQEASIAYEKAASEHFGEFARIAS